MKNDVTGKCPWQMKLSSCVACEQLNFEAEKLLIHLLVSLLSKNKAVFFKIYEFFLVL